MELTITLSAPKIARALIIIAFLLAIISIGAKHIEANAQTERPHIISQFTRIFNINLESSIPTWFASTNLLAAAALLGVVGYGKKMNGGDYSGHWLSLAGVFLYLSVDEASAIHEKLTVPLQNQDIIAATGPLYFAWVLVGIPVVLVIGILYLKFLLRLPARTRALFVLAAISFVSGALVIEGIGANKWYNEGSSLGYSAIGTVEEFFEMTGVIILLYALMDYIEAYTGAVRLAVETGAQEPKETLTGPILLPKPLAQNEAQSDSMKERSSG